MANYDDPEFYKQDQPHQSQTEGNEGFFFLPERFDANGNQLIPIPVSATEDEEGYINIGIAYVSPENLKKHRRRQRARIWRIRIEIALISLAIIILIVLFIIGVIH